MGEKALLGMALVRAREEAHFNMLLSGESPSGVGAGSCCSNSEIFLNGLLASRKAVSAQAGAPVADQVARDSAILILLGLRCVILKVELPFLERKSEI